jgi:hypothetical protein
MIVKIIGVDVRKFVAIVSNYVIKCEVGYGAWRELVGHNLSRL